MSEQASTRKPRLWLWLLLVLLLVAAMVGSLAYQKYSQIQQQIAQGSQVPPPISVTVAKAKAAMWESRVAAIGSLVQNRKTKLKSEKQDNKKQKNKNTTTQTKVRKTR